MIFVDNQLSFHFRSIKRLFRTFYTIVCSRLRQIDRKHFFPLIKFIFTICTHNNKMYFFQEITRFHYCRFLRRVCSVCVSAAGIGTNSEGKYIPLTTDPSWLVYSISGAKPSLLGANKLVPKNLIIFPISLDKTFF